MMDLQQRFSHYLQQLRVILLKVPEPLFDSSLAPDMFPLATHAKIAANFSLRGYCPLIGCEQVSFIRPEARFENFQALTAQIAKDVIEVRQQFSV